MSAAFDLRVLGPVQVLRDGEPLALGGAKRRGLLALLIANRNRPVSVATIVDALWEDKPPPSVTSSIQVAVSGLRSLLAGAPASGPVIDTVAPGYRLRIDDAHCDVARFQRSRALAASNAREGRAAEAGRLYREALGEWSGAAFADLRAARFALDLGLALDEERLATRESLIDIELELGHHRDLVSELSALTARHPLRESLWTSYMTALFRCGRQADALAAYRQLRTTLRADLGLEPGTAARDLERAILAQDPALARAPRPSDAAPTEVVPHRASRAVTAHLRDQDGRCTPIGRGGLKIGRMSDNGLVLDDPLVSRYHATIAANARQYVLTDHSANGTTVDGVPLTTSEVLSDGSQITIGRTRLEFRLQPIGLTDGEASAAI